MTETINLVAEETVAVAPAKLKKAEREFFSTFATGAVTGILGPVLEFKGVEITDEQLADVIATLDLTDLTTGIGQSFLSLVDFKTLVKVDKFMKSEEFIKVIQASSAVNAMVQEQLVQVIAPLIPSEEAEPTAEELADLAA